MQVNHSVLVVGCGNMGAALAGGYAAAHPQARVVAVDREPLRARSLLPANSGVVVLDTVAALADWQPDLVILALKPQVLGDVLPELVGRCAGALVVSIAAGTSLGRLRQLLGGQRRLVRAMPNLAVVVGCGMSLLHAGRDDLSAADATLAEAFFATVGATAWVADEAMIDAGTAVAGSGPAYFFALVEHLAAAGVGEGLPAELAARLARQTCIGAAALLAADRRAPGELKAAVCSPRGTTEAGLAAMEGAGGLPAVVAAGVAAAHRRARELAAD